MKYFSSMDELADKCRSPLGERGLKSSFEIAVHSSPSRRSPLGERGLKYQGECIKPRVVLKSLSAWRAWIEISDSLYSFLMLYMSLSAWRAWIEISSCTNSVFTATSLSAWRAWIEISVRLQGL